MPPILQTELGDLAVTPGTSEHATSVLETRQRNYEAGNIASLQYATAALPAETELETDLGRFLDLYEQAIELKRQLLLGAPGSLASPSGSATPTEPDPLRDFKPKDDSDYQAHIIGKKLRKSRRHETLVRKYGEWVATRGYAASTTEYPKDLVLRRATEEWLAEIKVVYLGNATEAVRAALGQLYTLLPTTSGASPTAGALPDSSESSTTTGRPIVRSRRTVWEPM